MALVVMTAVVLVGVLLSLRGSGDYMIGASPGADDAGPPLQALVSGHLGRLPALQPVMGLVSLIWRVPFVALASVLHGDHQFIYASGCAGCMLSAMALIAWMALRAGNAAELLRVGVAAGVILTGPATFSSLELGHPEEVLTTVLALSAVLAARADRRLWAALLLGLAIGSKQWALLTSPAVLIALPGGRIRAALIAAAVGAAATLPLPLLDPAAFHAADATIGGPIRTVVPLSLWWFLSPAHPSADGARVLPLGLRRSDAATMMLFICLGLVGAMGRALHARGTARSVKVDVLALLALIGLLRCVADPFDAGYYFVAVIIPLVVWEVTSLRRLPVVSVLWCVVTGIFGTDLALFSSLATSTSASVRSGLFLSCSLALATYLTLNVIGVKYQGARQVLPQLSARLNRRTLA